jgi:RNA polymerase sigma factor for flagellar operon FliA
MTTASATGAVPTAVSHPHTPEDLKNEPNYPMWVRLRAGDRGARDELVMRYAPLVKYVIGRLAVELPATMDRDDVLSSGTIGLLQAVDRYDPDSGVRFETYALQRIRGAIIDTVRTLSPLSRGARRRARALDEANAALMQRLGRAPSPEELADELGVDQAELGRMLVEATHVFVSLDGPAGGPHEDGEIASLRDIVRDTSQLEPGEAFAEREMLEQLRRAIESLKERDRLILSLYYHEELTLKEIGRVLGVSESRVCQVHSEALLKLRGWLRAHRAVAA